MPDISFCSERLVLNMCDKDLFVLLLCSTLNSLVSVLVIQTVRRVEEPGIMQELNFSLHTRNMICLPVQITYFDM